LGREFRGRKRAVEKEKGDEKRLRRRGGDVPAALGRELGEGGRGRVRMREGREEIAEEGGETYALHLGES
jgi:hypothetical protein